MNILTEFENKIEQFKTSNKESADLGITHLHLNDFGLIGGNGNSDVVFYVDLNEQK